ncbi:Lrp/AsnC family transcriptional regulator [Clostridium algoriphilum]|uniref:siroheme decarboxylase subunit beta n=1 Tax=Clostridium algoriphilum TaxID=198347 RepID=UPI001CF16855|nr:Lrp/AsnC family transcriptional regulator [Clostridium algoriphilum]MCB2295740.1 Lrp/AsnC family transcriptional regulator [Clostridium algoriphilum]
MLSCLDKSIIRRIQEDLPLVPEPYKEIAQELEITENELMHKIKEFSSSGIMRRFGTIVNHRNVGFIANAMVVWNIPEDLISDVSKIMISFSKVSHCYQRPTFSDWPYNVFTMVHAESRQGCEKVVKEIAEAVHINDYEMLYTTDELKKISMKYFIEE